MSKLPEAKVKELVLAIESLNEYDKIEIKRSGRKIEILRRSLYKEMVTLE